MEPENSPETEGVQEDEREMIRMRPGGKVCRYLKGRGIVTSRVSAALNT